MSVRFQADADLNHIIMKATLRREPSIDFQAAQVAGLAGLPDPEVLALAVQAATLFAFLVNVIIHCYIDNMIRTQISVDKELYKKAKGAARRKRISLAELVRQSLTEKLAQEPTEKPWMAFAGIFEGKPEDSSTVDEVVYGRERP